MNSILAQDKIFQIKQTREEFINQFRKNGVFNNYQSNLIIQEIQEYLNKSKEEFHAQASFEMATMLRIKNNFNDAIKFYKISIDSTSNRELIFNGYLGIARSLLYGTNNHGEALKAFESAIETAGLNPSKKQKYEIADYGSQLQAGRGELESALINGLKAINLASDDSELFYAQLDVGDVLRKFAESCDYRKLTDANSYSDPDPYGACNRAVYAAKQYYSAAKQTAQKLNWDFLVKQAESFNKDLDLRLFLIEKKAGFEKMEFSSVFKAQDVRDVLVNEDFSAGASSLDNMGLFNIIIDEVVSNEQTLDPRSLYLLGIKADLNKDPQKALVYYKKAVDMLHSERAGFFDLRQQGTVVENRVELVRDLGLRLLAFNHPDEAFIAFESIRAYGLSKIMTINENIHFTETERKALSDLIYLESKKSQLEFSLIKKVIAGQLYAESENNLNDLNLLEQQIRDLYDKDTVKTIIDKISLINPFSIDLGTLKKQVKTSQIPVISYWVTHTNILVWVISPEGMEIKTVFLPEPALNEKIQVLKKSISTFHDEININTAQELYTYLIAPFAHHLNNKQVIIIHQGTLVDLPFEALINSENGKYFVEQNAISYAPNASFAYKILNEPSIHCKTLEVIYNYDFKNELERIKKINGLEIHPRNVEEIKPEIKLFKQAEYLHVLLHGEFNWNNPLLSILKLISIPPKENKEITAAELFAIDWSTTKLAVFSSCEGGELQTRISNEIYGFAWTLLAGGVDSIVLGRWLLPKSQNSEWTEAFYNALIQEKMSPSFASQRAMMKLITEYRNQPYYWAGPQTYGK